MDASTSRTALRPVLPPLSSLGLLESIDSSTTTPPHVRPHALTIPPIRTSGSSPPLNTTPPSQHPSVLTITPHAHAKATDVRTGYRFKHRQPKAKRNRKGWGPYQSVTKERSVDFNLTLDIQNLKQEIQQLVFARDLLQSRVLQSRHSPTGSLMQIVRQYYDLFRTGFRVEEHPRRRRVITAGAQRDFLCSVIDPDLDFGNGLGGVEFLIEMLRRYSLLMRFISMVFDAFTIVVTEDQHVIIRTVGVLRFQVLRETVATIFPHVVGNEGLCARLIGADVAAAASVTFHFNERNRIYKVMPEADYVAAFGKVIPDPEDVMELLGQSKINDQSMLGVSEDGHVEDLDPYVEPEAEHAIMTSAPRAEEKQNAPRPQTNRPRGPDAVVSSEYVRVVEHYLAVFAHGWPLDEPTTQQHAFVKHFVAPDVVVGHAAGHYAIEHHWRSLHASFGAVLLRPLSVPRVVLDHATVVVHVPVAYTLALEMPAIQAVFPHVLRRPALVQALLGNEITCPGDLRIEWPPRENVLITRWNERLDWDAALAPLLPSASDCAFVLEQARLPTGSFVAPLG